MYSPFSQPSAEEYFANIEFLKNIDTITPTLEIMVDFKVNGLRAKKPCFVYAEKMDFKGLIQIRLTEKCDQRRMFICTVDSASFHELKHDQSLHVTFTGFIENLMRLLQDCHAGKLELHVVQIMPPFASGRLNETSDSENHTDFQLQFIEMRPFKNLVHLCLPCRQASLNVVLFYMNSILENMQKKMASGDQTAQQLQRELNVQQRRIEQMDAENDKLRNNLMENTRNLTQRHTEEIKQLQDALRRASEQYNSDIERHRKNAVSLQARIDELAMEKSLVQGEKNQAEKRNEALREELTSSRNQAAKLKEQNEKLHSEIGTLKNVERKLEGNLSEGRKCISELQEKMQKYEKAKADIVAELEAEKKISQTKRHALEMATEEISKANEIIMKQSLELAKLKRTVGWRTEVALQQEKAIKEKEKCLQMRDEEISHLQQTIDGMRIEIPRQLEAMRTFASSLELKYSEQIRSLKEAMKQFDCKENRSALASVKSRLK